MYVIFPPSLVAVGQERNVGGTEKTLHIPAAGPQFKRAKRQANNTVKCMASLWRWLPKRYTTVYYRRPGLL